jgi:hypothetical protein
MHIESFANGKMEISFSAYMNRIQHAIFKGLDRALSTANHHYTLGSVHCYD